MCGITGIVGHHSRELIDRVTDTLSHRGPDGRGTWTSENGLVSLGHRRLSVIDVSVDANQPMISANGRYHLVFNGEIYNFPALRANLANVNLRTSSDSEVLLETIAKFGFPAALEKLNGMFALAVYDKQTRQLHLARDRIGEKPLYFGAVDGQFVLASELKAISAHPQFISSIDRNSLALFLRYNCIPAPYSIYEGIAKLPAAHYLTVQVHEDGTHQVSPLRKYWNLQQVAEGGLRNPLDIGDGQAIEELESRIRTTVASRMVSDVPLGAFLSGGYDSTLVVAMMQQQSASPVQTFSIGLEEAGYNEAQHARAVADHLGTEHTEFYISPDDALSVIPKLASIYCEPFADSSQIPTYLVSELARQHVTVALSGDGGDEFFAGYNRHFWAQRVWQKLCLLPLPIRKLLANLAKRPSAQQWNGILAFAGRTTHLPGNKLHKLAGVAHAKSELEFYHLLMSNCQQPENLVKGSREPVDLITDRNQHPHNGNFSDLMMYLDAATYLPDDIMTKVDRASMAVSLEARVPLLDHELIEYAWRLPQRFKIRHGEGKWILKQIVHQHVPESMMRRPKMGFGVPLDQWLRGPLRNWASDLLDRDRLVADGLFDPDLVIQLLDGHMNGNGQFELQLWSLLMFQSWYAHQEAGALAA